MIILAISQVVITHKGISALNLQVKQTVWDVQLLHHMKVCSIIFWSVAYVAVADLPQ